MYVVLTLRVLLLASPPVSPSVNEALEFPSFTLKPHKDENGMADKPDGVMELPTPLSYSASDWEYPAESSTARSGMYLHNTLR